MDEPKIFRHEQYELRCSARGIDGGRFAPVLVIAKLSWPSRPRDIAVERGEHPTAAAAIDAAYAKGIEWIQLYGQRMKDE